MEARELRRQNDAPPLSTRGATYISRSFLYKSRGALGANYGAIHKSKSLMARLSPWLFKRDPVFYIISILHFGFTLRFLDTRRRRRSEEWEKSSEKNCKTFLMPAQESRTRLSGEISALLLRVFLFAGISSTQEAMRLHESIRRIADAMHSSILTTSVAVLV